MSKQNKPDKDALYEAVRILIAYAGDDPARAGVADTPKRVAGAYKELFGGYAQDPMALLMQARTARKTPANSYKLLRDIPFYSYCEHHMLPIIGKMHIAFIENDWQIPQDAVMAMAEAFARRLQIQEKLNAQIAQTLDQALSSEKPKDKTPNHVGVMGGVGVVIESNHYCMAIRGIKKQGVNMVTHHFTGQFNQHPEWQHMLLDGIRS